VSLGSSALSDESTSTVENLVGALRFVDAVSERRVAIEAV
jgi:hypothetical protein